MHGGWVQDNLLNPLDYGRIKIIDRRLLKVEYNPNNFFFNVYCMSSTISTQSADIESKVLGALFKSELSGVIKISPDGQVLDLNRYSMRLLHCENDAWKGASFNDFLASEDKAVFDWQHLSSQALTGNITLNGSGAKNNRVRYEIRPVEDASGEVLFYLCQLLDHQHIYRNTLIREVHHQIKNHLQGVMSLLEVNMMENPEVHDILHKSLFQINSLAITFGLKSQHKDGRIYLCSLVESAVNYASNLSGLHNQDIDLIIPTDKPYAVDREHAVAVSLVVNELLLNAIKHGGDCDEPIKVTLTVTPEKTACLTIVNHACQLPDEFDFEHNQGLGTGLALARVLLTEQMKLTFSNIENDGVMAQLELLPSLNWAG